MFTHSDLNGIRCYSGAPDCGAGYDWILGLLRETTGAWLTDPSQFNDRIKGNIGEFVAFHIVSPKQPIGSGWYAFYSNTDNPLARISGAGLDICYLFLGSDSSGASDLLYIQEVKTTGSSKLTYAQRLVDDHLKLTSANTSLNLLARVRSIKARMRDLYVADSAILSRIQNLAHPEPSKCAKVLFLPTLVHEKKDANPASTLADIRTQISAQGWQANLIFPVSISLLRMEDGFKHLAQNVPFKP